ncbi:hypothetical protein PN499_03610 [Kamptonema animale CS-326]|uniref:hypothetical protein n=1 Tax=Kamptonema animale TaxID=92934 RepID=UPI00232A9452|nr:hypothetical protein [Kamptonema animale]MDB9510290.1 hypothetical protein [Kamptonema animale CS-326]
MFELLEKRIQPLSLNFKVLEVAYELYLQAPQSDSPVINLKDLAQKSNASVFDCRNTIVSANKIGKFPNCSLSS